jgi:hypothetical protein
MTLAAPDAIRRRRRRLGHLARRVRRLIETQAALIDPLLASRHAVLRRAVSHRQVAQALEAPVPDKSVLTKRDTLALVYV